VQDQWVISLHHQFPISTSQHCTTIRVSFESILLIIKKTGRGKMKKVFLVLLFTFFVLGAFPALNWAGEPCIKIEKQVSVDGGNTWLDADTSTDAPTVVDGVLYRYIVTNCGDSMLYRDCGVIKDEALGIYVPWWGNVAPGEVVYITKDTPGFENLYQPALCEEDCGPKANTVVVEASACPDCLDKLTDQDCAWVNCDCDEGCTPGYWKQPQHFDSWPAPYTPDTLFADVFEDAFPGLTLVDVLRARGGGLNALGRHTVAALLNAASADVNYGISTGYVIGAFNDTFPGTKIQYNVLKDFFEDFNEQGCPLN